MSLSPFAEPFESFGLRATDPRLDALSQEVCRPIAQAQEPGLLESLHPGGGFMQLHLDPFSKAFIEFSQGSKLPVLDIGSAFGISTLPVLEVTHGPVIANDLGEKNLLLLRKEAPRKHFHRLFLNTLRFPDVLDFPKESLRAILICRVLHFLTGEEIELGLKKMRDWLVPGGKIFINMCTPYVSNLIDFVPIYEERIKNGDRWPGYLYDYAKTTKSLARNLTYFFHVMDERPLRTVLDEADFLIEKMDYIDNRENSPLCTPQGREGIGAIAVKRSSKS